MIIAKALINMKIFKDLQLHKNTEYVMADVVMHQLSQIYPGSLVETKKFSDEYRKVNPEELKSGNEVFLFRSGGIGDVMFMLPLISHLKKKYGVKIKVATSPTYISVIKGNPHVDKVIEMPFSLFELEKSDYHMMFEGVIEHSGTKAQTLHAVDLFLSEAGIDFEVVDPEDKIPYLYLYDEEIGWAKKKLKAMGFDEEIPRIGIQIEASSPIRSFSVEKFISLIRELLDCGNSVFIFGGRRQENISHYLDNFFKGEKNFINLISKGFTLRQSICISSLMTLFIAPDSSFIHIAGGLGVPVIGLYGCFPSLLRMKYYKNAIGIDCNVVCAPSFIHGHSPCEKGFPSPCFSVISVEDIMNAVDHLLKNKRISTIYPYYNEFRDGEIVETPFSTLKK